MKLFWAVSIGFLLIGCQASAANELQGRWHGDSVEHVDLERLAAVAAWAKGLTFEFDDGEVRVAVPNERPRRGRYEVVEAGERQLVLSIQRPGGQLDVARFTLDTPNRLRWHIGEGRAIVLRRGE